MFRHERPSLFMNRGVPTRPKPKHTAGRTATWSCELYMRSTKRFSIECTTFRAKYEPSEGARSILHDNLRRGLHYSIVNKNNLLVVMEYIGISLSQVVFEMANEFQSE